MGNLADVALRGNGSGMHLIDEGYSGNGSGVNIKANKQAWGHINVVWVHTRSGER